MTMDRDKVGKNMSDAANNAEERIVENEETKMGVTNPLPPSTMTSKLDYMETYYTLPTVDKKGVKKWLSLRWTPSLGQCKGYVKVGFCYPQGIWC